MSAGFRIDRRQIGVKPRVDVKMAEAVTLVRPQGAARLDARALAALVSSGSERIAPIETGVETADLRVPADRLEHGHAQAEGTSPSWRHESVAEHESSARSQGLSLTRTRVASHQPAESQASTIQAAVLLGNMVIQTDSELGARVSPNRTVRTDPGELTEFGETGNGRSGSSGL